MAELNVPPEVEREFEQDVDRYLADWETSLRKHLGAGGESDGEVDGKTDDSQESFDESRAASLIERASQIIFDPQTGIYP